MQLSHEDVELFHHQGYLSLPVLFDAREIEALADEAARLSALDCPQRILEKDSDITRSVYWVHGLSELFDRLVRDPRLLGPARALLSDQVYLYQTQLNPKASVLGDVWKWHQDYLYWHREDGMPNDSVLSVALYLDEVTEFNGPLFVVPQTHRAGLEEETATRPDASGWENTVNAEFRHEVDPRTLARLVDQYGLASTRGVRGTVFVFHGNLLHSSPPNLSPALRTIVFARYAAMHNQLRPVAQPRPSWIANREPAPVTALTEPLLAN
ncbi:phytanoyl-CoA dioxygenase family protein [Kitasatospora sp. NBC_01266]|uniref:phytanoyl-CoA dioxygenase family protein n=1 Tax=Kitasatospora sp. NBC_01266 TaxID=2903572 RepID=UPI002E31ABAB|nr:phytanoyl-CoA dioxygenase family protein [Kitasatospora sp. NBC_01266]